MYGFGSFTVSPENGWLYASERAAEIAEETIRQANLIISYSKNISDVMKAHQVLVFLYSSMGDFNKATSEAREFPIRSDFTLYSNMARVNEYMGNNERVVTYLCSDNDYCSNIWRTTLLDSERLTSTAENITTR